MRRIWLYGMLVVVFAVAVAGLGRLRLDPDILSMLPGEMAEVKGLKAQQKAYARPDEAILLLEADEEAGVLAERLAARLEAGGVVAEARWQPKWRESPEGLAQLVGYVWWNGKGEEVERLVESLKEGASEEKMAGVLEDLATSLEGQEMAMRAHDPLGLLEHPALREVVDGMGRQGGGYENAAGTAHFLRVRANREIEGYREAERWIREVVGVVREWEKEEGKGVRVGVTGEPAFAAEIGMAMERDLSGSIGFTLTLIGLLFWWMQRRLSLLGGLVVTLALVFAVALGVAGWVYGDLSMMALSSAEILIGLATDYGLVICQEGKLVGHDRRALLAASGKPVVCGALTTALVFSALHLGGLPGMAQLGGVVAFGLLAAAVLMVTCYVPWVARFGREREEPKGEGRWIAGSRTAWWGGAGLVVVAVVWCMGMGWPEANFDSRLMRPRESEAMDVFERMRGYFPEKDGKTMAWVIEAESDEAMMARIEVAGRKMEAARRSGVIARVESPAAWWPNAERQAANGGRLAGLAEAEARLTQEAEEVGFAEEGLALGRQVLRLWKELASDGERLWFPDDEGARELLDLMLQRDAVGGGRVMGKLVPGEGYGPEEAAYPELRAVQGEGLSFAGWELLKPALMLEVGGDLQRMLIPMLVVLIGMMGWIFRGVREVVLAIGAMLVSTVVLLALMRLFGLKWNFVNLMATPLLLGTGIDYAIHVILTLKRTGGSVKELWNGTGKALLFCGASNVIGFGSLCFSSSDALVSLGQVAVLGILLSLGTSLFLLPGWYGVKRQG